jgi:hypothetical protein
MIFVNHQHLFASSDCCNIEPLCGLLSYVLLDVGVL